MSTPRWSAPVQWEPRAGRSSKPRGAQASFPKISWRKAFGRGEVAYDPWHYVPVLARKPGALRKGVPFRNWLLPPALADVRRKLKAADDGDRQMIQILSCVADNGLPAVEAACREALDNGVDSAPIVINILARRREPAPPPFLLTPAALRLTQEPVADCARLMTASRQDISAWSAPKSLI